MYNIYWKVFLSVQMDFPICEKQIKSRVLSEAAGETGLFRTINVGHNIRRQPWSREHIKAYLNPFFTHM